MQCSFFSLRVTYLYLQLYRFYALNKFGYAPGLSVLGNMFFKYKEKPLFPASLPSAFLTLHSAVCFLNPLNNERSQKQSRHYLIIRVFVVSLFL